MDISLEQLLKLIRKNIVLIVICAAIGFAGAFSISKFVIPKTYISTVKFYVSTVESRQDSAMNINSLDYAQKVVNTYIEMLKTNRFYHKVMDQSKLSYTVDRFQKMVNFSSLNNTEVFQAQVSAHDPSEAKTIADAITMLAPTTIGELKENSSLKVVDFAVLSDKPSFPNTVVNSMIGLILGAMSSVTLVLLHYVLDVRIKNEDDLIEKYHIPVLASIPAFSKQFIKEKNYSRSKAGEE